MKTRLIALIAAVLLPAMAWAEARAIAPCTDHCPIPCDDCPFAKR